MSSADFVREIRLRQWARRHYVPVESRRSTWHPVVLDEMLLRDRELGIGVVESTFGLIEGPAVPKPHFGESSLADFHAIESGSRFVPLFPGTEWSLHPATSEIPAPHLRGFAHDPVTNRDDVSRVGRE